jgi:uncharacterized coiled-coil protein SlyX
MTMESSKRNMLWFAAAAVGLIAALAYSVLGTGPTYAYRTDVFIGEHAAKDEFQPFEPVSATEAFVLNTLLIAPTTDELRKLGVREVRWSALINVVEAGRVIRIQTVAGEDDIQRVKTVHKFIADGILERIRPRAAYVRALLDGRLASAEETLRSASENLAALTEIITDARTSEAKIREQAHKIADQIAALEQSGQASPPPLASAGEGPGNEAADLGIRGQLAMYQKLGLAELPFLRVDGARTVVALRQAIAQSRQTIREINGEISFFREPVVTQFVLRGASATKPGLLMTMLVGLVAGLAAYVAGRAILRRTSG